MITRAANAYELLEEVIKAVQEEPRRLDMHEWFMPGDHMKDPPPCGWVGCVGGWSEQLHGGGYPAEAIFIRGDGDVKMAKDLSDLFMRDYPRCEPGTPEYVAHVVARIRAFQSKYETVLRSSPSTFRCACRSTSYFSARSR